MKFRAFENKDVRRANDPYAVLKITRQASAEEIKAAYKKAALEHHPDRNPGSQEAEERFKLASAAYTLLSNAQRRSAYDRSHPVAPSIPRYAEPDPEEEEELVGTYKDEFITSLRAPFTNSRFDPEHPLATVTLFTKWLQQAQRAGISTTGIGHLASESRIQASLTHLITSQIGAASPSSHIEEKHRVLARTLETWRACGVNVEGLLNTPQVSTEIRRIIQSADPASAKAIARAYLKHGWIGSISARI